MLLAIREMYVKTVPFSICRNETFINRRTVQLAHYFHLDEDDLAFILQRSGDQNRFGVALQVGCFQFQETFLSDLSRMSVSVRWLIARQLGIIATAIEIWRAAEMRDCDTGMIVAENSDKWTATIAERSD